MADAGQVLVTGATGGLGLGVVEALLGAGHDVVGTWVVEEEAERAAARFGPRLRLERLDVGDPEGVGRLADGLAAAGGPWGVAHLVGGYHDGDPVPGLDLEAWDRQMALNLRSAAVVLRGLLGGMVARGGGRAVVISSRAAMRPFAGSAAYAASKAGLLGLVGAASEDVKSSGVTVNALLPSVIDTPGNRRAMPDADPGDWVSPEEIGAAIAFLMSDAGGAVTGAAIPVDARV
jgi:NAD(P)-dependent dehydrogenase (short-subunit alcohol dehydrogenase family)